MSKKSTFVAFIVGGMIGSSVALLYAPQSGEETRQKIYEESTELRDYALKSMHDVRESALSAIKDAQTRMDVMAEQITEALNEMKGIDQTVIIEGKQKEKQPEA